MAYIYILRNIEGKYYVGSTSDVEKRLLQHRSGQSPSTRRLKPDSLELVLIQEYSSIGEARAIEAKIKKLKRKDYIERMVSDGKINMRL